MDGKRFLRIFFLLIVLFHSLIGILTEINTPFIYKGIDVYNRKQ